MDGMLSVNETERDNSG